MRESYDDSYCPGRGRGRVFYIAMTWRKAKLFRVAGRKGCGQGWSVQDRAEKETERKTG